MMCCSYCSINR